MKPVEFRRQVFRDVSHWEHGLSHNLRRLAGGGVALFSIPGFGGFTTDDDAARDVGSLAVDECGRLFWIYQKNCQLYRRDPINTLVEPMISLAECDHDHPHMFGRMFNAAGRLWILDYTGSRLIAIRPDTFQIISEIPLTFPIDAAFGAGHLFTLDHDSIRAYDAEGTSLDGPSRHNLSNPVALGVGTYTDRQWIYVIDAETRSFLRYSADSRSFDSTLGSFDDVAADFRPRLLVVHPDGNLFVSDGKRVVHEFSPDGGYIGHTEEAIPLTSISALTVDAQGDLYLGTPKGIALFSRESGVAGNKGMFYTRTLDNGAENDEGWHRVDISAELDAGGAVDVYYASAKEAGLAGAVDDVFARSASTADKAKALDLLLGDLWKGPQQLRAVVPPGTATATRDSFAKQMSHSVLFRTVTKRYLWLKLAVSGLAPKATASVREMRVYYPRLSYLRYLPAVYQQDRVSQDFLERFLSMFETVFSGLEDTIERISEVFDPNLTPGEFLDWLAQWLDLVIEEDWPPDVRRRLIQNASRLYQQKGTPQGLAEFIEIVTGRRPIIRESFETERPFVLGDRVALGVDSLIQRQPMADVRRDQRTVLGHASVLGDTGIRATVHVPVDPFRAAAHRFTVSLDLSPQRFTRYERGLNRIIRENAPAHVGYEIRLLPSGLGGQTTLGVNFTVADPQPMLLGYSALGASICARRIWYGPQLGMDATLAGRAYESKSASAFPDGER